MKSFTDVSQSKKLAEFLPLESADMYYFLDPTPVGNIYHLTVKRVDYGIKNLPQYDEGDIPCWSLTALLELIPNYDLSGEHNHHTCLANVFYGKEQVGWYDNPIDACVKMIEKLHELKML